MYESRHEPLLPRPMFVRRIVRHGALAAVLLGVSLGVGIAGYMLLAKLSPIDAFLNASMILGGMGPVDPLPSDGAKLFAGLYALFSGLLVLVVAGVVLAPVLHRVLHKFHLEAAEDDGKDG